MRHPQAMDVIATCGRSGAKRSIPYPGEGAGFARCGGKFGQMLAA